MTVSSQSTLYSWEWARQITKKLFNPRAYSCKRLSSVLEQDTLPLQASTWCHVVDCDWWPSPCEKENQNLKCSSGGSVQRFGSRMYSTISTKIGQRPFLYKHICLNTWMLLTHPWQTNYVCHYISVLQVSSLRCPTLLQKLWTGGLHCHCFEPSKSLKPLTSTEGSAHDSVKVTDI